MSKYMYVAGLYNIHTYIYEAKYFFYNKDWSMFGKINLIQSMLFNYL